MNKDLISNIKRPILYGGKEYLNGKDFLDNVNILGNIKFIIKRKIPMDKIFYIKNYMCNPENLFMMDFHRKYNGGICCPKNIMKGVVLMEDGVLVKIRTEEWVGWLTKTSVQIEELKEE